MDWSFGCGEPGRVRPVLRPPAGSSRPCGRLLAFVSLADWADAKVEALSGGMKRRLTIARALVNSPQLLLLDEPTTGLDPQARHLVWERLFRLKQQGVTLVLTTHYMDEAEQLCDRLVVMDRGKIVAEGSPQDLIERYSTREVVELRFDDGSRPDDLSHWTDGLVSRVESLPDRVLLYTDDGDAASHGVHERGLVPEAFSSGAARSRTSFSISRAGASSSELRRRSPSGRSSSSSRSTSACGVGPQ